MRLLFCLIFILQSVAVAAPPPGGIYASTGFNVTSDKPCRIKFSWDGKIPFNPVEVSPKEKGWDFYTELKITSKGPSITFTNHTPYMIPVSLILSTSPRNIVERIKIKEGRSLSLPLKDPMKYVVMFLDVYDEAAIHP